MTQGDATRPASEVPFFARFLEGQEYPHVKTDVKAGKKPSPPDWPPAVTQKWPSDDDEDPVVVSA